jgi:hypothetical protein
MKELLSGLIGPVTGIINKVVPDKDEAARLAHEISTMADRHAQALAVAQIEVNRAEAAGNWFQASWRPLCGYVCVLGLAVNFLISPIAAGFGFVVPQPICPRCCPFFLGCLVWLECGAGRKAKGSRNEKEF